MDVPLVTKPYHLGVDEGRAIWHLGTLSTFKATGDATAGQCWIKEALAARGTATPRHIHSREDEAFYVLDGALSFYLGDTTVPVAAGGFVWAPRTIPHAFCVESESARFLTIATPSGFEHFFFAAGTPADRLSAPPATSEAQHLDMLAGYGVQVVGPAPTPST